LGRPLIFVCRSRHPHLSKIGNDLRWRLRGIANQNGRHTVFDKDKPKVISGIRGGETPSGGQQRGKRESLPSASCPPHDAVHPGPQLAPRLIDFDSILKGATSELLACCAARWELTVKANQHRTTNRIYFRFTVKLILTILRPPCPGSNIKRTNARLLDFAGESRVGDG